MAKLATVTIKGVSPYSPGKHYSEIEAPKLDKESFADYEARTWRNRMHVSKDGKVQIPPMAFKNCLSEAAKYLSIRIPGKGQATYTKHFTAGVLVSEPLTLPVKAADVPGNWLFVPADGVRGSGKRVNKCFPLIEEWGGVVNFQIFDETVTEKIFTQVLREAGMLVGIGTFRPINNGYFGRFAVDKVKWGDLKF